jgi:glycosyltransferase involved in cell wall biosynthesis
VRILLLSNFFPPLHLGGYEGHAAEVAATLCERGHCVDVLTSNLRARAAPADPSVRRLLHLEVDLRPGLGTLGFFAGRQRRAAANAACLRDTIAATRPDVLLVFGMWNLPRTMLAQAEGRQRPPLVYYVSDYWPSLPDGYALHWQAPARRRWTRLPKRVVADLIRRWQRPPLPPALAFAHALCVSQALRARLIEAGLPFTAARVVHNGIDLRGFPFRPPRGRADRRPIALGYLGRTAPEKGIDTLLAAMAELQRRGRSATLALAGRADRHAAAALRRQIHRLHLSDRVTLRGGVPREQVPALLAELDVLVVPSVWPEPLARVIQEAMATGAVVVATAVGGTVEIVEDGINGLLFAPGDAAALADRIERLSSEPALGASLSAAGRRTVEARFDLRKSVDAIEEVLQRVAFEPYAH